MRRNTLVVCIPCHIPGTHRYQLTHTGRAVAVLFTNAYGRILGSGLAALDPRLPGELAKRGPLATAWRNLARELDCPNREPRTRPRSWARWPGAVLSPALPQALASLAHLVHVDRAVLTQRQRGGLGDPAGLDGVGYGARGWPAAADDLGERGEFGAEGSGEAVHEEPVRGPGGKGHAGLGGAERQAVCRARRRCCPATRAVPGARRSRGRQTRHLVHRPVGRHAGRRARRQGGLVGIRRP